MLWLAGLAALAWTWLLLLHGRFWSSGPSLKSRSPETFPPVTAVVPARNEAALVGESIGSLLAQDYPGPFRVILVDDGSEDGTGTALPPSPRLTVLRAPARPEGWAGKLWAVAQGVAMAGNPRWLLLTDADIVHDRHHVATLVAHGERAGLAMVSEMVELRRQSWPERALIPAFVYFFQMLYPFAWVNERGRRIAAAAGGTVLIQAEALAQAGGIAAIRGALIDDVALARAVKRTGRAIWLGHSQLAKSVRPYPRYADVWHMIARSAYVQLRRSPVVLLGTVAGLALVFVAPPVLTITASGMPQLAAAAAWLAMAASFVPTLRRFRASVLWAPALPAMAVFYLAATVGSAIDHHRGRGVVWKSRAYAGGDT